MGLDLVEIVMAVEETFNIEFDDKTDFVNVHTVGEFYDVILSKLKDIKKADCISNIIFYKLRKGILEITDLRKREIRPTSKIEEIFKKEDLKSKWRLLEENTRYKLPELVVDEKITKRISTMNWILTLVGVILILFLKLLFVFIVWTISIIINRILSKKLENHKKYLPKFINTISDVVNGLIASEYRKVNLEKVDTDLEVWTVLVEIIVEQSGIEPNYIIKTASLVRDLGLE